MTREIDPTTPVDGISAIAVGRRDDPQAAAADLEVLLTGRSDPDLTRVPAGGTDAGALIAKGLVEPGASGAITPPVVRSAADAPESPALITLDGGATWHGFHAGKDCS